MIKKTSIESAFAIDDRPNYKKKVGYGGKNVNVRRHITLRPVDRAEEYCLLVEAEERKNKANTRKPETGVPCIMNPEVSCIYQEAQTNPDFAFPCVRCRNGVDPLVSFLGYIDPIDIDIYY